jgi:hypothetical protein
MSIDIDDIPVIESAGRLGRRPSADSSVAEAYPAFPIRERNVIGSIGVPLILELVNRFQPETFPSGSDIMALQGRAAGPSYTTYFDCGGYDYNGTCNEACFGFAPHHMDPFYCATCDEQAADPTNNPAYNWHLVGSRFQIQYMDREPDVCAGKDAWKWKVGTCGDCQESAVFRCHDGYKKYPNNNYWDPTICQGLVACDNRLTPC